MTLTIISLVAAFAVVIAETRLTNSLAYRIARGYGQTRRRSLLIAARSFRLVAQADLANVRERRRRRNLSPAERLLEEQAALTPPDAIPAAPDVTRAQRRHHQGRAHPVARKRRTGGWR